MVQLFIDGGGFMWPILFIFIIGFVFVGERLYHLVKGLASNEQFAMDVAATLENSGTGAAKTKCEESIGPVANLCFSALEKADEGVEAAEKALDQSGSEFEIEYEGDLAACCVQHEIDHLHGKVFVDYLSNLKKERIERKLKKFRRE